MADQGISRRQLLSRSLRAGTALAAVGGLGGLLAACGGAASPATGSSGAATGTGAAGTQKALKLTYPSWMFSEPDTGKYYQQLAAAYTAQNPSVTVDLVNLSSTQYVEQIFTEISAGQVPDILPLFTTQMPQYMSLDLLQPLDEWLDSASFKSKLLPLQKFAQKGGKNYGIVLTASPQGLIYNSQLLEKAGVDVPQTIDDLYNAAQTIYQKTGVYGIGIHTDPTAMLLAYVSCMQWVLGYGSDFSKADGTITCNAPATVQGFQEMMRFVNASFAPKGLGYDKLRTMFAQGKVAMLIDGPWDLGQVKTVNPQLYPSILMAPSPTPTHAAITGGAFYTMLKKDTHQKQVWDFMAFATSDTWQQKWIDVEIQVPGISIEPDAAFLKTNPGFAKLNEIASKYGAGFGYFPPGYEQVATAFQTKVINHVASMWAGSQSPKAAMDAAQQDLEAWAKTVPASKRGL